MPQRAPASCGSRKLRKVAQPRSASVDARGGSSGNNWLNARSDCIEINSKASARNAGAFFVSTQISSFLLEPWRAGWIDSRWMRERCSAGRILRGKASPHHRSAATPHACSATTSSSRSRLARLLAARTATPQTSHAGCVSAISPSSSARTKLRPASNSTARCAGPCTDRRRWSSLPIAARFRIRGGCARK